MNDLNLDGVDLRAALHRDADLVGEPSPDLLDQLVRRRAHQHRQRAGLIAVAAAVAVIGAGIPVGASFLTRSHAAPATQTASPTASDVPTDAAPITEAAPTASAPAASSSASAPLVASWSRETLYGLSFVVPVDSRVRGVFIPDEVEPAYAWNENSGLPIKVDPPIHLKVATSAIGTPPTTQVPDANRVMLTMPGATSAWETHSPTPPGLFPGNNEDYWVDILTSGPRFYSVHIAVPATDQGAAVAQKFLRSLSLVTGSTGLQPAGCPTLATLLEALQASPHQEAWGTSGAIATLSWKFTDTRTDCSGDWAVAFPDLTVTVNGDNHTTGQTELFQWTDGRWQLVDRVAPCSAGQVPAKIHDWTCNTN